MAKVDVLIVAETKIDVTIPTVQFSAEGYHKSYHLDISEKVTLCYTVRKVSAFGVFLVRILEYLSVFSSNGRKHGPVKLRIRTLFTQC